MTSGLFRFALPKTWMLNDPIVIVSARSCGMLGGSCVASPVMFACPQPSSIARNALRMSFRMKQEANSGIYLLCIFSRNFFDPILTAIIVGRM